MKESLKKEIEKLIKYEKLNCTVEEFKDYVDWINISKLQLSEDFIREFKDLVHWKCISQFQNLPENFIREFKDKVYWYRISEYQKLSEDFIREFKYKVDWINISIYQKLSEDFIREFKDKVHWEWVSKYQTLSENFIREFKDKVDIKLYKEVHQTKTKRQKEKEMKGYAKKHDLKFDGEFLYAFREHDQYGRGLFNKTISYEKGKYYKDWHCDMRKEEENSFGLGIFPKGNTKVKIKVEDWGLEVDREDGKARVWGFEII